MMVFEFIPANTQNKSFGNLILHIPNVPPSGDDPGHIYRAASGDGADDWRDLAAACPGSTDMTHHFSLEGLVDCAGITGIDSMDNKSNVCIKASTCGSVLGGKNGKPPLIKIVMPLPRAYRGYRSIYTQTQDLLTSSVPPYRNLPDTIYMTHIFVYSRTQRAVLMRQCDDQQVWPNTQTQNCDRLYIFAQPLTPSVAMNQDHAGHLHELFDPNLNIQVCGPCWLHQEPAGNVVSGFQRDDLHDWNDPLKDLPHELPIPAYPCANTGSKRDEKAVDRIRLSVQPTNCRSYGYGS